MTSNRSKFFPVLIAIIFIVIVIYLFANIEQTVVKCSKKTTDDLNITVLEELETSLEGKKIGELQLKKTIILPQQYLPDDDKYLNYLETTIKKSYAYLGKGKVKISKLTDRLVVYVTVSEDETLILNNISFNNNDGLGILINSNTKSSDVVTLRVKDSYTQGQLITHMKNNGYSCG